MIFLDSWIWIEYFLEGSQWKLADKAIEVMENKGGVISTFTILEIKYRLTKEKNLHFAKKVTDAIKESPNLIILPLSLKLAEWASDLKAKYYSSKTRFSYGDAIMLSTALASGCDSFHTGDPDFKKVEEIPVKLV